MDLAEQVSYKLPSESSSGTENFRDHQRYIESTPQNTSQEPGKWSILMRKTFTRFLGATRGWAGPLQTYLSLHQEVQEFPGQFSTGAHFVCFSIENNNHLGICSSLIKHTYI